MSKELEQQTEAGLEENFAQLEELIRQLSEEDITLEQAFSAYSQGMQLVQKCNGQIDAVEKKVMKLAQDGSLTEL